MSQPTSRPQGPEEIIDLPELRPVIIEEARPDHAAESIAELIWTEDQPLMRFLFGGFARWRDVVAAEWTEPVALNSHSTTLVALDGDEIVGLMNGFPADEFEPRYKGSLQLYRRDMALAQVAVFDAAVAWAERLFPMPRTGAYYVLDLAVSERRRRAGRGREFLKAARQRARQHRCSSLCLDVAADSDAVDFYCKMGWQIEIETRVPFLAMNHGIGPHYQMMLDVDHAP